jgi:hypothetical protein
MAFFKRYTAASYIRFSYVGLTHDAWSSQVLLFLENQKVGISRTPTSQFIDLWRHESTVKPTTTAKPDAWRKPGIGASVKAGGGERLSRGIYLLTGRNQP